MAGGPDEPFHNFKTSKSSDQGILCSSGTSWDGLQRLKIVIGLVGGIIIALVLPITNTFVAHSSVFLVSVLKADFGVLECFLGKSVSHFKLS